MLNHLKYICRLLKDKEMKTKADFLVVRLNGEAINVTPISEIYTSVQIRLDQQYLTEKDVLTYYQHMNKPYQLRMLADVIEKGYLFDEQEAKDVCCKLSQYEIKIETRELEF